ncbi:hypothetical protein F4825DRAFT_451849 [Nemania diffusa]|nr:hypothetical protein F4825DRAFT_451849 [Nemania diffusa]
MSYSYNKHTARAEQRAGAKMAVWRPDQQRTSTHTKPKSRQKEQEIEFARSPSCPPNASPPSLGTRFAGLPAELRAEILAWLLVRPVKWSATHMADCPLRSPELTATPFEDIRPRMVPSRATCAAADPPMRRWRHCTRPIWRDPWRSEWAPPITNEFLCSSCWDERFRSYSCPRIDSLPCLCARKRRADGFAALLVCRAWYEEGARVLYARNTFAFASPGECFEFVRALNPHWAALVTKVSLLALTPIRECPVSAAEESDCVLIDPKGLQEACIMLQKLPALSELELDALFLTRPDLLDVIREAPLRNLRKISFTKPMEIEPAEAPREFVWPRRALRKMIEDTELAQSQGNHSSKRGKIQKKRKIEASWYTLNS